MYNIIGNKKIWFTLSAVFVGAATLAIVLFGFRQGIDFAGGTLWEFSATGESAATVHSLFTTDLAIPDARVSYDAVNQNFLVRFGDVSEVDHQKFLTTLSEKFPAFRERSFQSIGPSVGKELRRNALIAIALVLIGISLYIAFAFRKTSRPVSSWKYGWITLLTLFHDVAIPAGLIAVLGHYAHVEIDSNFVVALLVVMGFSVHDTIVVFDRIRENLVLNRGKEPFEKVVNTSVNQTLARSINTSLTLILVLIALYFTGPADLRYFILTLLVGVTTGVYSSIFIASPGLVLLSPTAGLPGLTKKS
ncbi:MAG: protein-export membrane protein SecF [Candidatus Liptonbacteria bacterium RIFCSPLOWO2_01_FULL_52_25]|uniref:Protein-export membrane protein SecF n=1 Tax=Candidatus Liptonbacteria bacterium RIFCSPLOWO2_01_FULL_52_25 TaxID=1798650 RepID=A0A1G2CGS0_9BACT|nr:MAG: protein-export membrane protein SecF [Candidatus Liptonbacteria bacterium RIFCSPLOWO2_01_FULL_52_25]